MFLVKLIRFASAALIAIVALLLVSCGSERVESFSTVTAAAASPNLLKLIRVSMLIAAQQPSQSSTPDQSAGSEVPLPDGPGLDTVKKVCTNCHSSDTWAKQRHTRDEWSAVIDDMTARGMNASDKDLDTVLDYLSIHFAPEKKDTPPPPSFTD